MSRAIAKLAAEVNAVRVTLRDLLSASSEIHKLPEDQRDWEGRAILLARMYAGQDRKAMAVGRRLSAMARLIESGALPHWVLPKQSDGAVMISEPVFLAAAAEPLLLTRSDAYFDREHFVAKVLELAKPDGNA